jgi:hypothetical protein
MIPVLDGYAIIPSEEYERLKRLEEPAFRYPIP